MGNCCHSTEPKPLPYTILQIPDHLESKSINIRNFRVIAVLGKGSFGKVLLMEKKDSKKLYAIKTILKRKLYSSKNMKNAMEERKVLARIASPFVVKLHYAFQDSEKLYLVLDFMQGGDLYYHLKCLKCFSEEAAVFFAAEIVLALEDLHSNGILYRDLKPENILLDSDGHIKLADFNLAKNIEKEEKTNTICGTPEYISPEILEGSSYGREVDFWGLGVILYEMIEGKSPFYASNHMQLYTKIVNGRFSFSDRFSAYSMDLISQLLSVSIKKRLISMEKIKSHKFFEKIDWKSAYNKMLDPPIKPAVNGDLDTKYFNPPPGSDTSPVSYGFFQNKENTTFQGFTYEEPRNIENNLNDS
jgi:serine/threonine protein kinase